MSLLPASGGRGGLALPRIFRIQFSELQKNHLQNSVEVAIDVFIHESDDPVTARLQKLGAPRVVAKLFVRRMRRAVDFDNQLFVPANEVGKVTPDRLLAEEFEPAEAACAQRPP